jgi:hypothetical protein
MKTTDGATIFSDAIEALATAGLNLTDMRVLTYVNAFPPSSVGDVSAGTAIPEADVETSLAGGLGKYVECTDDFYRPNPLGVALLVKSLTDVAACAAIAPASGALTSDELAKWEVAKGIILDFCEHSASKTYREMLEFAYEVHKNPTKFTGEEHSRAKTNFINLCGTGLRMTLPGEAAYMNLDLLFGNWGLQARLRGYKKIVEKANNLGLCLW